MVFPTERVRAALDRPIDGASFIAFRVAFGLALTVLALRFFGHGWIAIDYENPKYFVPYWGFSWVRPWPAPFMYVHYGVMAASGLAIAAGRFYRPATVIACLAFTYAHLCDISNYLNHYYLVSLVTFLLMFVPRVPSRAWQLWILRFQFGVVYTFGGIAKIGSDWLLHGEPLRIWLGANVEMPILGRFFDSPRTALVFSWAGMLFDLSIVSLLLWPRTRRPAYVVALVFHGLTAALFHIGMFPWLMSIGATLFFDPSWPRRFVKRLPEAPASPRAPLAFLAVYALLQVVMPLRHFLYPGNTLWTEEGFRYAWRIMLIEKSGTFDLVVADARGRRSTVDPRTYLSPMQLRMTSTQPDMILYAAHLVAADWNAKGVGPVRVFADARVSWNGRASAPLIDPTVDLAAERDSLAPKPWILPAPTGEPEF